MRVHLVNPNDTSFGIGVITPRWLYVLAQATPDTYGVPLLTDETLAPFDLETVAPGDVVGIGIHTGNVHRGYELGRQVREQWRARRLWWDPRHPVSGGIPGASGRAHCGGQGRR